MEPESKELKVIDRRTKLEQEIEDSTPNAVILKAMDKGYSPELIEKMMNLAQRNQENMAKQAYVSAMANFKKNPPKIEKDRHVQYDTQKGKVDYRHASLANVTEKISSALGENGLSASWITDQQNGNIKVTCTITHELGHSESTSLSGAADLSGSKNAIQAIGSTISYLQRYTLLALTGLATHDMDDDGSSSTGEPEYISEKQLSTIVDMINAKEVDQTKFCEWLKVDAPEHILAKDYNKALNALKAKK